MGSFAREPWLTGWGLNKTFTQESIDTFVTIIVCSVVATAYMSRSEHAHRRVRGTNGKFVAKVVVDAAAREIEFAVQVRTSQLPHFTCRSYFFCASLDRKSVV